MKFYSKGPVRISLCNGGDTDYYIKTLGWSNLINATLESGAYFCEVEKKDQHTINYYYKNNFLKKSFYREINLNEENSDDVSLVMATLKEVYPSFKGDIKIWTNVPEKCGLGGSSSLVISLIKSLIKAKGISKTPEEIAWLAYKIERIILGIKGGYQDQWAAAFSGGVNYLEFKKNKVFLEPLWLSEKLMKELEQNISLFFLEPRKGDSGNIHLALENQSNKQIKEDKDLLIRRRENVTYARDCLLQGNIKKFADILKEEHENKLKLVPNLLTPKLSRIYSEALNQGALAGKICGAGSGGCAFFVTLSNKNKFIKKMEELGCMNLPLKFQRLNSMGEI